MRERGASCGILWAAIVLGWMSPLFAAPSTPILTPDPDHPGYYKPFGCLSIDKSVRGADGAVRNSCGYAVEAHWQNAKGSWGSWTLPAGGLYSLFDGSMGTVLGCRPNDLFNISLQLCRDSSRPTAGTTPPPSSAPQSPPPRKVGGDFDVDYGDEADAFRVYGELRQQNIPATMQRVTARGRPLYRVHIGAIYDQATYRRVLFKVRLRAPSMRDTVATEDAPGMPMNARDAPRQSASPQSRCDAARRSIAAMQAEQMPLGTPPFPPRWLELAAQIKAVYQANPTCQFSRTGIETAAIAPPATNRLQTASANAPGSDCVRTGSRSNNEGELFFTLTNVCNTPVVAFYCYVANGALESGEEFRRQKADCRYEYQQHMVAFGRGIISQHAPRSIAEYRQMEAEGQMFLSPGQTWESSEYASYDRTWSNPAVHYRAIIVGSACPRDRYLSGQCRPDALAAWRRKGRPTP